MKVTIAMTITKKEGTNSLKKNILKFEKSIHDIFLILNTDLNHKEFKNINLRHKFINDVGDMKKSRHTLLSECYKINSDIYFVLDSDIEFNEYEFDTYINKLLKYKSEYDFISMYYMGDSPLPAFYSLSSSLNDFYNKKINKTYSVTDVFFDDSDYTNSTYYMPNDKEEYHSFENIVYGKRYSREIEKFTDLVNEKDNTTGGATVYFNKECLLPEYNWPEKDGKSLTWYDSFRTFKMNKKYGGKYNFAKVPIYVEHNRHKTSISLNWSSVINYIEGYNYYMDKVSKESPEKMIIHTIELMMYSKGMIKKISRLENLTKDEKETIKVIKDFLDKSHELTDYYKGREWK